MASTTQDSETFRWRSWPCPKCSEGATPIGHLFRSFGPNDTVTTEQLDALIGSQVASLREWTDRCGHSPWNNFTARRLAEGSEHAVYLNKDGTHVCKRTLVGKYGEFYYIQDNRMFERRCTPLKYLLRIRLIGKYFGFSAAAIGLTESNQIFSVQRFVSGEATTQSEVDLFLTESGFTPVKQNCWLWNIEEKIEKHTFKMWIGDARSDNFVKTAKGIIPIDIRMWVTEII